MKKLISILIGFFFFAFTFIALNAQDWVKQSPLPSANTPYDIYCTDSNTIIISCQEGIFKTVNRGLSWSESTKESSNSIIEFYFITDQVGWGIGNDLTILKTTDGGVTWITQKELESDTSDLNSVCFSDLNNGWVVGDEGTILFTNDGGETWNKQISTTMKDLEDVHFGDSLNGYSIGTKIVLRTTDGGVVWDSITNLSGLSYSEDVYCFNADTCLIVAGSTFGNEIHRTTDGGENWTTSSMGGSWLKEIYFIDDMNGWLVGRSGSITVDIGGDITWNYSNMAIWKTEDGGLSWDRTIFEDVNWLYDVYMTDNNTICASGTNGLIIQTSDKGDVWYKISKGTSKSLHSSQFLNSQLGYTVGNDGVIMATPDGGNNWIQQESNTSNDLFSVQFINSNTGWVVGENGIIRKTINYGNNWNSQTSGINNDLFSVCFTDSMTGYIVGEEGTILKTTNSGSDWTQQTSEVSGDLYGVYFIDEQKGWAVGNNGSILHTINGGDTWTQQTSNTSSRLNSVYFRNDLEGLAIGASGLILNTLNGGETWQMKSIGSNLYLKSVFFLNSDTGWIVGTNTFQDQGIILRTTDSGKSWALSNSFNSCSLISVYFIDIGTGWIFGNNGIIFKTISGGGTYHYYPVPQLLSPENNSTGISLNPALMWRSIDEAIYYRLQVSCYSSFSSTIIDQSFIIDTSYSLSELDNDRNYYWRICATYENETEIWSGSYIFRTCKYPPSTPSLYSPDDGDEEVERITTLNWSYVSGADSYHLQVSEDPDFSSSVFEDSTLTDTDYEIGPLKELTTYYWRVRAKNNGGHSLYSEIHSFTTSLYIVNIPSLYSPGNGSEGMERVVTLEWSYVSGADTYHLQVSENIDFSSIVFEDSTLTTTDYEIGPLEKLTTYYWHVRCKKIKGTSPYSEINYFTTESGNWSVQLKECVNSICFINEKTGWAAGYYIYKTVDGGTTWNEIYDPSESINDIQFIDTLTGWAVGVNGMIIKTSDGGYSWENQTSGTVENLESVYFINSLKGWAVGDEGIFSTTTGGESWINQYTPAEFYLNLYSVYFINENMGFATGWTILKTTDGGDHWHECTIDDDSWYYSLNSVFFVNEQNGWAVGYDGILFKTTDSGESWSGQLSIIPADLNDVYFIDELNGWIVGDDGSMIKTTNGGNNWDVLYRESTENIKQVQFANQDTGWVIAGCNIIKTETGGGETCSLPYPILDEPNNYSEAFPDKVTLRWHTVIGATSYRLQISKSPVFIDPIYDEERLILTSQIISDLDTGMVYFWRVNASNDTFTSLWSDTWLFTTYEISLSAPVLNSPSDGSVDQPVSIILSWNESDDADKYYLQVDNDPDFSSPIIDNEFILSESEFVFNLDINTTYYWRVKALNYNGSMSPWSETWIFTTTHSVGINESGYDTRYKLYPNPVNDVLFVEGFENELTNISILSLEGKLLKQIKEKGMIQIDVSDLQNGIYLVKIVNSKIMITEKIVKQ